LRSSSLMNSCTIALFSNDKAPPRKNRAPRAPFAPLFVALFNDYWLADAHAYKYALSFLSPAHSFEKILVVNGDGTVDSIFEA
jgi:hypothetical protein